MAKKANKGKPQNLAPQASASSSSQDAPHDFLKDANIQEENVKSFEESPMQLPPNEEIEMEEAFGAASWYNNKKISSMWANKSTLNCYAYIAGLGWKKISTKNKSITHSLNSLLSHAYASNRNTKIKLDNNIIVEAYVW